MAAELIPVVGSHKDSFQAIVARSYGQHKVLPQRGIHNQNLLCLQVHIRREPLKEGFLWKQPYGSAFRLAVQHLYSFAVQTPMACPVPCCNQRYRSYVEGTRTSGDCILK